MKKKSGFSLLEVMLAITILSTLSVLSTQAISRALKARTKIQAEVDDVSSLRDSMRIIRTDLNLAYHHRDFEKEINDIVAKPKAANTAPGAAPVPPPPPPTARKTTRIPPDTHFMGEDSKMNFVTMNNGRMTANLLQADFIEVGYSLRDCRNLSKPDQNSRCLFRRTQSVLDDDVSTGGQEVAMLENVTEFKLRYIGGPKTEYVSTWNSTKNGQDEETKNMYPDAVEVSLTIEGNVEKKKRVYSMQFVIPIHFPNNPDKPASKNATNPAGNQ
ncbi:MAG: prepilin-type N-terminal cleavage/methylation domain-containing protein [Bdellovibrionaceae bacterium]|nr:prepilin-type N-terminal cleavage/methylation domain-containing protein [Bdellovibrio sp.]